MSKRSADPGFPPVMVYLFWGVIGVIVVIVLFRVVFPWVEEWQQDPTMGLPAEVGTPD